MTAILKDITIGDCRLILGDCLKVMPLLSKFDAVVTDPPYGTDSNNIGYGREGLQIKNDTNLKICHMAMQIAQKKIVNGYMAAFYSPRVAPEFYNGFKGVYAGQIVWDKKTPGMGKGIRYQHESVAIYKIGNAHKLVDCFSVIRCHRGDAIFNNNNKHPHQKPIPLMKQIIKTISPQKQNTGVLDFFMGSGSTGVACAKLKRKFTGIELDPVFFELSCKRIAEAYKQPDLFASVTNENKKSQQSEMF